MAFGSAVPRRFGNTPSVPMFPRTATTYSDPTGAVVVPGGSLNRWFAYRNTLAAVRCDVVGIGDSTMFGSGGLYSLLQRLRDRAVIFGMADGGKGMFAGGESLGITYDAPEISGYVSSNWGGGFPDAYDNTDGQYFYDTGSVAGHELVLQFRQTAARLWYSCRGNAGDFTYLVKDGATTVASGTVQAYASSGTVSKFIYISGLAAATTHTITITNLALSTNGGPASGAAAYVALAPINATGIAFQKYATSGDTINSRLYGQLAANPYTQSQDGMRYQTAFGLTPTTITSPTYRGAPVNTSQPAGGAINPVLAISNLGFNDLSNAPTDGVAMWTEYVKRFAGACYDASCDGIIVAGQLPYNAQWPTYGAARFNALKSEALNQGLVFVDLFYPIGGPSLAYSGGTNNPHLFKDQYQTQADFLWDNLLGLRV